MAFGPHLLPSYHTGPCCAALGRTLCLLLFLFPHSSLHRITRCQAVGICWTSLSQLKDWQSSAHNQQKESALFPVEEEGARRWAEDIENSVTRLLSPPPRPLPPLPLACVVCVSVVRVDSWRLFVFTSEEKWIQGGEDSNGRRAELSLSKAFLSLLCFGFHLWPLSLQNIRQTS